MIISEARELRCSELPGYRRALCLDYGNKRIGVAVSDINWTIASPLKVLESHGAYPSLLKLIDDYDIGLVIVGIPKALNGESAGSQLEKVQKFAAKLDVLLTERESDVKIAYWDERLSTVAANRLLAEADTTLRRKQQTIDKVAASFILQGFLDFTQTATR